MRGLLVLAGLLVFAAVATAPPPAPAEQHDAPEDHLDTEHQEHGVEDQVEGENGGEHSQEQDNEENVFASVELAATNADLAIKLMKRALSVLLESSATAMESTEALLKTGVVSVNSIASGASAAAKQLGITPETLKKAPEKKPTSQPEKKSGWFW